MLIYLKYRQKIHNSYFSKDKFILKINNEEVFILKLKKPFIIFFSLLSSAILFVQLGVAQVGTVGVSEGDWFKYGFSFNCDSELNITSEEFPFADFLEGEFVTLTIEEISGTYVTGQFTIHFENGTEQFQSASVDLTTGEGDLRNWLISSNLNANDSLYASEVDEKINETLTQTYFLGSRETNHIVYSYHFSSGDDYSDLSADMFWDREIGILTKLSFEAEVQLNGTSMDASAFLVITESNIEDIPEFTQPILILILFTLTPLILILKKRGVRLTPVC
jgi:hypothetical protein